MKSETWLLGTLILDRAREAISTIWQHERTADEPNLSTIWTLLEEFSYRLDQLTPSYMSPTEKENCVLAFIKLSFLFRSAHFAIEGGAEDEAVTAIRDEAGQLLRSLEGMYARARSRWLPELWATTSGRFDLLGDLFREVGRDLPQGKSLGAFYWDEGGSIEVLNVFARTVANDRLDEPLPVGVSVEDPFEDETVTSVCTLCRGTGVTPGGHRVQSCGLCKGSGQLSYVAPKGIENPIQCRICGGRGTGIEEGERWTCVTCEGKGVLPPLPPRAHRILCPVCQGRQVLGPFPKGNTSCPTCEGLGVVDSRKFRSNDGQNQGGERGPEEGGRRCC